LPAGEFYDRKKIITQTGKTTIVENCTFGKLAFGLRMKI